MPTVYQCLLKFYEKDKFRFKSHGRMELGRRVVDLWVTLEGNKDGLVLIPSVEGDEIFDVYHYPDSFIPMIDQTIRNYHKDILQASKDRKIALATKPTIVDKKPIPEPVPEPPPIKKERKRIPAKPTKLWYPKS